jgi:hypothetical protein
MPDEDVLTVWMARCCEPDAAGFARMDDCYESYEAWAKRWKEPPFERKAFADQLDRLGFYRQRRDGVCGFEGLRLRERDQRTPRSSTLAVRDR